MTFKPLLTGIAVTGLTLGSLSLASVPAHALSIGSQIDAIWFGDASTNNFDFATFFLNSGPEPGFTFVTGKGDIPTGLQFATIKDIPSFSAFVPIDNFIYFGDGVNYNFSLSAITPTISGNSLSIALRGIFADGTPGVGTLTTQLDGEPVRSWSATVTAVPTPALLPGLLGLGIAALRRKDGEPTEENA
ncbi:PTPA-CTERM sorting domain-containing protein [Nodosilinea sp. PGN35]|uniref:PTPA-CTERM sorting domain-containing protein n=1 Tax=Nodosilinea sp. PGN35 TaxID=3020489 RepID=UPI0023B24BC3|nr:PTPA-CTERM sorting domain-containing protein [Nodosilinea sp. TSF1-S3]MDF0367301.1 PTPA-CTERM sorting domain-containing protein [Nodosilinea sp. TSF1-S3]